MLLSEFLILLIGAKWFIDGSEAFDEFDAAKAIRSVRDSEGHGTHCASTAAGVRVNDVSFAGLAAGTAVGGAPYAKIAVYKVCWQGSGCADADVLSAFDEAAKDGVDIISLSVGPNTPQPYDSPTSIIKYHAAVAGILVSESAGNEGPGEGTVTNVVPWAMSVGASTTDRVFIADVELGDGKVIEGLAINSFTEFLEGPVALVSGGAIPSASFSSEDASFCVPGSLDTTAAFGKVVLCKQKLVHSYPNGTLDRDYNALNAVLEAQGYGAIIANENFSDIYFPYNFKLPLYDAPLPESGISFEQAAEIETYITDTPSMPTATVKPPATVFKTSSSQQVGPFSSRGPNRITPDILKPDLVAPGVDILAAYTEAAGVEDAAKYTLLSGTSMACPHASGAAALIKAKHRTWSPAGIKSALMTTAKPFKTGTSLDWGAGEIDITSAVDPGLIYDLGKEDYDIFLCGFNFSESDYNAITGQDLSACPVPPPGHSALNYPSMSVSEDSDLVRTLTYVDDHEPAGSTYTVTVSDPAGASITVDPQTLTFSGLEDKKSFTMSIRITSSQTLPSFGSITWSDGSHNVNSIVMVHSFK
ncbi:hypothetical protein Mapa_012344 [Marchantia paleacea]|nr:hypothetical protein Mapa_012344 [Marchantia paleacea]